MTKPTETAPRTKVRMAPLNIAAPITMHDDIEEYAQRFAIGKAEAARRLIAAGLVAIGGDS